MRLSVSDLATLRLKPQQTKLHLSIFRPTTIFKARVNGAVARGERTIPYDSVSLGSFGIIRAGQTMLVGSADGLRDKGKVRVRSADGTTIVVAENSDINWQDDDFFFIQNFFEVWPVYPRITHDPANDESVLFFKDYDIEHTNQNIVLGSFANAGPHRAIFRDCASGVAETYWSSTGTHNLLSGTIHNYYWTFEGGTPSGSTSANPGLVTYNAPGHYVTSLSISGSQGTVDTTYRYISVYDYPGCGTGTPPLKWELNSLGGSRSEGGYNVGITLHEVIDIHDGDVVIIFAEDWYGSQKVSLGGNHPSTSSIVFSGYVLDDSIRFNYRNSTVDFQAGSISSMMKLGEGFSCSVESKVTPATWFELADMDVRRAIYHYLRWHTTVLNVTDVQFLGDDKRIQFFDADRTSLYDAIDSLIRSALVGSVVSDRQSKLWLETEAYAVPNATGTYSPVMSLEKDDWIGEPRIDEALSNSTSFIEMGGIAFSGPATGTFSALLANAPGDAPSYRGKVDRIQGLALTGQSQLNQLVGNVFANRNAKYPVIDADLSGNYRNLDIAPQEAVQIDILPEDNMRGKRISAPYYPDSMQWSYDPKTGLFTPSVTFNIITTGETGQTIIIPDVPPDEGFNNPDISGNGFSPTFPVPASLFGALPVDYASSKHGHTGRNVQDPDPQSRGITVLGSSYNLSGQEDLTALRNAFRASRSGIYAGLADIEIVMPGGTSIFFVMSTSNFPLASAQKAVKELESPSEVVSLRVSSTLTKIFKLSANDVVYFYLALESGTPATGVGAIFNLVRLSS
jgi:hypothetical protein